MISTAFLMTAFSLAELGDGFGMFFDMYVFCVALFDYPDYRPIHLTITHFVLLLTNVGTCLGLVGPKQV